MPRGLENALIDFLSHLFQSVGWSGVFLGMMIESAAIPLPSEVIMPLAGWLLIQARGNPVSYVLIAGLVGALGCVTGSLITYYIGAIGGRPLLLRYGKYIFLNEHHLDLADRWFAERGEITAFVSRLLPVVRTFISIPAGIARMNVLRFVVYTFLGSFLWCAALATGGYYAGSRWEELRNAMRPFDYPIAAIVVVGLIIFFIRGRQSTKRTLAAAPPASASLETVAAPAAPKPTATNAPLGFYRPRREEVRPTATASPRVVESVAPAPAASVEPARPITPPVATSQDTEPQVIPPPTTTPRRINTADRDVSNDDAFQWFGSQESRNNKPR